MTAAGADLGGRFGGSAAELAKVAAFIRRDWLVAISHRAAFFADAFQLALNALVFALVAQLVDASKLPAYDGSRAGYLEFVVIGIAFSLVIALLLQRVAAAIRQEQLIGTLEMLLLTPTAVSTLQAGAIAFDLLQVPLRVCVFMGVVGVAFGLDLHAGGVLPAFVVLVSFLPFVWGLGLMSAGAMLTFRRGGGAIALAGALVGFASGAYFPLTLLPGALEAIAGWNPMTMAIDAVREALIGGAGWDVVGADTLILLLASGAVLGIGWACFRLALARERRLGTLGLY